MAWRQPGDKALSEPIFVVLPTHTCVTRPQWVEMSRLSGIGLFWKYQLVETSCGKLHLSNPLLFANKHKNQLSCFRFEFNPMPTGAIVFTARRRYLYTINSKFFTDFDILKCFLIAFLISRYGHWKCHEIRFDLINILKMSSDHTWNRKSVLKAHYLTKFSIVDSYWFATLLPVNQEPWGPCQQGF